ncbi:MAG: PhzF family phenazine biosynthesis protein [Dethiobacteria bacterium]|nr:PhzF family phenazine biosynthesis protein [Dethiobacteria bacterium]
MAHSFYLVDVFAESKYAGNQLAVVRNAADLSALDMQKIAAEMNYSETTFILSDEVRDGGYDVRIFSLDEELPFAGHPTLGTAYIIQQQIIGEAIGEVRLNLKAGQIPVTFSYLEGKPDQLWMQQIAPTFGRKFSPEDVARAINIDSCSIDQRFPIEEVSTGLPFIIVPLKDLAAIKKCNIDRVGYMKLIDQAEAKSIFVFCSECYDPRNQINARMFDDFHGIAEDPATGSANGCLAAYLVKNRYYGSPAIDIKVEQGYEIGRPSLLLLKAAEEEGVAITVSVGGRVIMVAGGELV